MNRPLIFLFIILLPRLGQSPDPGTDEMSDQFDQSVVVKVPRNLLKGPERGSPGPNETLSHDITWANIDDHSYHVVIAAAGNTRIKDQEYSYVHICGGTIVGNRWILTAARCFMSTDRQVNVRIKVRHLANYVNYQPHRVEKVFFNRRVKGQVADVALLRLVHPLNMNEVKEVMIPEGDRFPKESDSRLNRFKGKNVKTISYIYSHYLNPKYRESGPPLVINYTVLDHKACADKMHGLKKLAEKMFKEYKETWPSAKDQARKLPQPKRKFPFIPHFNKYKMLCTQSKIDGLSLNSDQDVGSGFVTLAEDNKYYVLGVLHGPFKTRMLQLTPEGKVEADTEQIEISVPQIVLRVSRYSRWINLIKEKYSENPLKKMVKPFARFIHGTTTPKPIFGTLRRRHSDLGPMRRLRRKGNNQLTRSL